jgi:hypothetical protein
MAVTWSTRGVDATPMLVGALIMAVIGPTNEKFLQRIVTDRLQNIGASAGDIGAPDLAKVSIWAADCVLALTVAIVPLVGIAISLSLPDRRWLLFVFYTVTLVAGIALFLIVAAVEDPFKYCRTRHLRYYTKATFYGILINIAGAALVFGFA